MKILYFILLIILGSLFFACTPNISETEDDSQIQDSIVTNILEVNLWKMASDTVVADSNTVIFFYADIKYNSEIITDSSKVKFYASFGSITPLSYTIDGQAVAEYKPLDSGGNILSGKLKISASCAVSEIIYDSLYIYIRKE